MKITAIVAVDKKGGMGVENRLLCHLPDDLKFFKERTLGKAVIMGRRTYESIGKPLPNRLNVILTRQPDYKVENCLISHSIPECMDALENKKDKNEEVFIIGGANIFEQTILKCDRLIMTVIDHEFLEADAFFPQFDAIYNGKEGWNNKRLILNHQIDEKHKYNFSVYEIDRDKRYSSKYSPKRQLQILYS